ncbi:hypothetical protein MOV10_14400 [Salmonella enterica subsp. enterica serovar Abeokuta]|uniref:Uncharacterized protein n=1 Tax=Salmonella enterica subsp. enterica serovar Abeokuta TaxID=2926665 RepID=A0A8T9IEI0_SALET|nr:hypothetical protein [Salmonella enterica]EDW9823522.1 hypothetical protein [Salmonella enterica]UNO32328.1 hypothetical protein MOV10_14400 [Salmonella enterica subsp. enterica serovar Abeokuta]
MTNSKLTDERFSKERLIDWAVVAVAEAKRRVLDYPESVEAAAGVCLAEIALAALIAPQPLTDAERAEPELNPANLVNKFYERYPLASFRDDGFRATALGYFMAGAELQCFGEFIKYEDLCGDE